MDADRTGELGMTDFKIQEPPNELTSRACESTSHAGLALVGQYFERIGIAQSIDPLLSLPKPGIVDSAIVKSYPGSLVRGIRDSDAIRASGQDGLLEQALGVDAVPPSPTPNQRMEGHANDGAGLEQGLAEGSTNGGGLK